MKIKNYLNLWIMSLLIVSMNQLFPLNKMPDNNQEQVQSQQELIELEEFPPYSTDQYVYAISSVEQPTESDIVADPVVISDVIANNYLNSGKIRTLITQAMNNGKIITTTETWKTKHPSYFTWSNGVLVVGAIGVIALTYIAMKAIVQKNEQAFVWNVKMSEEQFKELMGIDMFECYKKWLLVHNESEISIKTVKKYNQWLTAAHESGHALEAFLNSPERWIFGAINGDFGGAMISLKATPLHNLFPASLKHDIKVGLAGGVGISVIEDKKLNFEDFLSNGNHGMGNRESVNSDLYWAYKLSEKHFERMNVSVGSWIPKDYTEQEREQAMVELLKECYEETYQDISSHKDELNKMTEALYKKEIIGSNEIYTIATGKTQDFFGLMSSNEQWKKYLTDILRHESQSILNFNEESAYQIHDVLG